MPARPRGSAIRDPDRVPATDPGSPRVSVVLPVLNEVRDLGLLLDQLRGQEPPPGGFEVLVADGGSTDGTRELVEARRDGFPGLRLLDNPGRRSGPGRNVGAAAARGGLVLFLDGHCSLPRKDYLVRMVELFDSTGAGCLCRPQPLVPRSEAGWAGRIARARHSAFGHNPRSDIYRHRPGFTDPRSAGAAYRAGILRELEGYDERFDACEDVEFNHRAARAGHRAYLHPDLAVEYRPRQDPGALFRQMFGYGRGRARLFARHPATAPVVLWGMTGLALLPPALAVAAGLRAGLAAAGILAALWLVAALVEGLRLGPTPMDAAGTAAVFAVIHAGLLLGFWRGLAEAPRFRGPAPAPRAAAPAGEAPRVRA